MGQLDENELPSPVMVTTTSPRWSRLTQISRRLARYHGICVLHVDNEADAAIFMLMTGVVETLSLRMLWMILHRESVEKYLGLHKTDHIGNIELSRGMSKEPTN